MNAKFAHPLIALLLLLPLAGCVSPTTVDYDRSAVGKLSSYKCFQLDSRDARANYQDVVLSPIVDRRIERALETELLAKGFSNNCAKPDFRVSFNTVTKSKTEVHDFGTGLSAFRRYPYHGYGGYSYIDIDQYEEGTFVVDIIDHVSKELVWRGAYVKRLGWSAPTETEVQKIVAKILEEFPPGIAPKPD